MVHDSVEQCHDRYNSFLSSSSFNSEQTQVVPKLILLSYLAVQLDLRTVIDWNRSYLQCSQYNERMSTEIHYLRSEVVFKR